MRLNEITYGAAKPVEGYGPGFFRIGGTVHQGALLVLPGAGVQPWAGLDDREALLAVAGQVDVLLIGTGTEMVALPPGLRPALEEAGIGVEIMASATAARSYNVLLSDGRRVGAALLPV